MKLPNYIKNNFWVLNYKPILGLTVLFFFIVFCAKILLSLIDLI